MKHQSRTSAALLAAFLLCLSQYAAAQTTIFGDSPGPTLHFSCMCEHLGSPLDGICEASVYPANNPIDVATFNYSSQSYSWSPFGAAYLSYPPDPTSGFAIYQINYAGRGGGLNVYVTVTQLAKVAGIYWGSWVYGPLQCAGGTVGAGG